MRLHKLTLTAFGPFGGTQEVDFDTLSSAGIFLLHGPTGAGKTSVLDAVCYGLYGAVPGARQSPGTSLRSDHAQVDRPTEVRLELTVGGAAWRSPEGPPSPAPRRGAAASRPRRRRAGCGSTTPSTAGRRSAAPTRRSVRRSAGSSG